MYYHKYKARPVCKFQDCENVPKFGCGGYCHIHEKEDPGYARKQAKLVAKTTERKIRGLALVDNTAAVEIQELERWYADRAKELDRNPYCAECGAHISKWFKRERIKADGYRNSICHILPKRKTYGCPSVRTHPANCLFLGHVCGCHSKFDSSWEAASKMKVWPLAVHNFIFMYPSIATEEHKNIPEQFLKYVEPCKNR